MSLTLVTYDLNRPGQDYDELYKRIEALGETQHLLDSTWAVDTVKSADEITKALRSGTDSNDYLFVVEISKAARQGWLPKTSWEWLDARG